jgi:hypothetical protein
MAAVETATAIAAEHLFDMAIDLAPAQYVQTPDGMRITYIAQGGVVSGPRLQGRIRPGGGDWIRLGADGVARLDVRATIETDSGALVLVTAGGICDLGEEGTARLLGGERVPWTESYVRTALLFETGDPGLEWLNGVAAIAVNELAPDHVDYRVYRV